MEKSPSCKCMSGLTAFYFRLYYSQVSQRRGNCKLVSRGSVASDLHKKPENCYYLKFKIKQKITLSHFPELDRMPPWRKIIVEICWLLYFLLIWIFLSCSQLGDAGRNLPHLFWSAQSASTTLQETMDVPARCTYFSSITWMRQVCLYNLDTESWRSRECGGSE